MAHGSDVGTEGAAADVVQCGRARCFGDVQWIVSEFRTANIPARLLVRALYLFFGITTGLKTRKLADHRPILQSHGFRLTGASHSRGGLVVSELWKR